MVGDPKHLSDLAKIEAAVAARCRACGQRRVFDRDRLNRYLRNQGGVPAWSEMGRSLPCRCGSADIVLKPVPFAKEVRDPDLRRYQRVLIELSVAILEEAAERGDKAQTLPVRLALRVLLPYVMHRGVLLRVWQSGGTDTPLVRGNGLRGGVSEIREQLVMLGRL